MADTAVVSQIEHYQKSIEKYADNEARVLHCIEKLYRLPVTVQHLQETGVGRTINGLRKYDGTVGDASKALVAKWKSMVADEESSDCDDENESCMPDVPEKYSDNSNSPVNKSSSSSSRHKSHKHRDQGSSSKQNVSKHSSSQSSSDNCKSRLSMSTITSHNSVDSSRSSNSSEKIGNSGSKDKKIKTKSEKHEVKKNDKSSGSHSTKSGNEKNESSHKSSTEFKEMNGDHSHRKRTHENSSSESITPKRRKEIKTESMSDENPEKSDDNTHIKHQSPSNNCASTSEKKIKTEKPDEKTPITKHKHSSEHNKSSSVKDDVKSEKKKNSEKDSTKSHSDSKSKDSESNKKHKDKKSESSKDKHSKDKSPTKSHKPKYRKNEGIDCNSGTSFADALGMCTGPLIPRKKNPSSPMSSGTKVKSETSTVSSVSKNVKVKTEPPSPAKENQEELSLLAANVKLEPLKLEPLNVDIASTLPEISTNYKPLPVSYMNPIHRKLEEDKALSDVMYAKNLRTKVYSGVKTSYTIVPSLQDLCIRVLIDNIDALEATGDVPYYIMKPVLERATPDQLYIIEHYNPYFIEDTAELWKFHCNREFRTKQREEMESWREMYMRCLDERDAKLKLLTANIKQSQDKSLPVRVTKLAYVDNVVKPPRNILKKQAKYGTANASSSSDIKKKLLLGGSNIPTNISVPPPPMGRSKSSGSGIVKKNKAPLMAKALQLIKGRYKR